MTTEEIEEMVEHLIAEDNNEPNRYRPIVLIGHSKDLVDYDTVEWALKHLSNMNIPVVTFDQIINRIN